MPLPLRSAAPDSATTDSAAAARLHARAAADVAARHDRAPVQLVQVLRELQEALGWLPPAALDGAAEALGVTGAHVRAVASFYRFFHLEPVGRVHLLWSDNVTDRMAGSHELFEQFCKALWIEPGRPRPQAAASAALTSCIGLCDQGPSVLVDQRHVVTRLTRERVREMAALIEAGVPPGQWPAEWRTVEPNIRRADVLLSGATRPGEALQAAMRRGRQALLDELRVSQLRGRGGAGFATAAKWQACLNAPPPEGRSRVVVCNADEGEPGTFKDRVLLTHHVDDLLDGMTLAAWLLGARDGFIYLRGEYRWMLDELEAALAARRAAGLLGRVRSAVAGEADFDFDIAIHLGAGAYVCGEESALIESLEGKRGVPRIRPPFPVERGYLGRPTIVNNVETFCAAARIALHGGTWWAAIGTPRSAGTKLHSVSGDCARPGIYEYPWGVSVRQVLQDCGADDAIAVQVGGASGVCIRHDEFDRLLAFEDVPTAGAFMVFGPGRDLFDVARSFTQFFAHESCGFCTPCRVGTTLAVRLMDKLARGRGSPDDLRVLGELEHLMHTSTHCGLGVTATNPLRDTLLKFRPAYERRLGSAQFMPGFDLEAELSKARAMTAHRGTTAQPLAPPEAGARDD